MSWIEKLCEVYDSAVERAAEPPLLPVGFVMKQIRFNVTLSADGRFVKAEELDAERQNCMVPSTPEAEGRTGTKGTPFPLADCLKYLLTDGKDENPKFEKYLAQLTAWCACEHAPDCLRALRAYLEKRTLYTDLLSFPGLNVKYRKAEGEVGGKGADERSFLCFSVEAGDGEDRLWMRRDVRESWARYLAERPGQKRELCYVTGEWLPVMENHPKLSGNAKLISGEDAGFPFRYKGRFIQDRSAAAVSMIASVKAHNALKWLMERQGFRRYGMSLVGWNTGAAEPLQMEAARRADSFEPYLLALRDAVQGDGKTVILGMQAATDGRMSIVCEQELPGNELAARLENWYAACRWSWPGRAREERAPTWREICEAVIGGDQVRAAMQDGTGEKAATRLMRETQIRLMSCVLRGEPLPRDFVTRAFHAAVLPLRFKNAEGAWQALDWARCVATACAMLRKQRMDGEKAETWTPRLDLQNRQRDYLYGRLLAVACMLEKERDPRHENVPLAARSMLRYVQRPAETWEKLYLQLIPSLQTLRGGRAMDYQNWFGQIERLFQNGEWTENNALSELFLLGYSAQEREMCLPETERQPEPESPPYCPPKSRDELFGCLLAVAEQCEQETGRQPGKNGANVCLLMRTFAARPAETWVRIHDRLIPYLEAAGVDEAKRVQRMLRRIEQGFDEQERLSQDPLGSGFLRGYLCMLRALRTRDGLDRAAWEPLPGGAGRMDSRDAAFGTLLAVENQVERWALDLSGNEDKKRPSNAMRFMTRTAQRPNEVWTYLRERMRPYERSASRLLGYPLEAGAQVQALRERIRENGWDSDVPLGPGYLYYFYTCQTLRNEEEE